MLKIICAYVWPSKSVSDTEFQEVMSCAFSISQVICSFFFFYLSWTNIKRSAVSLLISQIKNITASRVGAVKRTLLLSSLFVINMLQNFSFIFCMCSVEHMQCAHVHILSTENGD